MKEEEFRNWLNEQYSHKKTIDNRLSNCKKIVKSGYDLDQAYDKDGGESLIDILTYSKSEFDKNTPVRHNIEIGGNQLDGTRTLKAAAKLYFLFRDSLKNTPPFSDNELKEIKEIENDKTLTEEEKRASIKIRIGHSKYRRDLVALYDDQCVLTKNNTSRLLIASHIIPWAEAELNEKTDPHNGLLLSPVYDALFDKHLMTFDEEGTPIYSKSIEIDDLRLIMLNPDAKLDVPNLPSQTMEYMKTHRSTFQEKEENY